MIHERIISLIRRPPRSVMAVVAALMVVAAAMVVGVVNETHPNRIYNTTTLTHINESTREVLEEKRFFMTGLPIATDTYGVEMFRHMGIPAPLAGLIVFMLMWLLFRLSEVVRSSDARVAQLKKEGCHIHDDHFLVRLLRGVGPRTLAGSKLIVAATLAILVVSVVGISRIQINDNPVRWFRPDHRIGGADRVLDQRFGSTCSAFLALEKSENEPFGRYVGGLLKDVSAESETAGRTCPNVV